jgi:hypothetical protein
MNFRHLIATFFVLAASAFAADVDGKWTGNFETPGGAVEIAFDFKQEGAVLTGTSTGPDGTAVKIADGKVDGNKVSFNETVDFGGMPFTISFSGEMMGASMKLVMDFAGMPLEIALKKA